MDQNKVSEAKTYRKEIRTILMMDLQEISLQLIRVFLPDQTSHMGTTIRVMENLKINAQISHSIEATEIDIEKIISTIRMEAGETMEDFCVLHRLKG